MQSKISFKIVFSCFLASLLEMYDFIIFGFLGSILHKNYLGFLDEKLSLIVTYAFFAVGFVFRPIGSLIFGYIGDLYGRKKALVLSVSLMGGASLIMFALPTYEQIGIVSCLVIVVVRIVQGVSVGGEFTGAIIYAVEHSNSKNAGLIGGIVSSGGACGILLATIISKTLQAPDLPAYGWRFAFLIGFGLSIIGYIIRTKLTETPVFKSLGNISGNKLPILEGLKFYKIESLATFLTAAANGISFYFVVVFLSGYLKNAVEYNVDFVQSLVVCTLIIFTPLFGYVSDLIGRYKVIMLSTIMAAIYGFVALDLMAQSSSKLSLSGYILIYALLVASFVGTVNVFVVEIFPPRARMSNCSVFYSLGMGFIGGTFPMVASAISHWVSDSRVYLGGYISMISILAFLSVLAVLHKKKIHQHQ